MERLSTSIERELEYLSEIQKKCVRLEEHENELVRENIDLRSKIGVLCKQIKDLKKYAPHYKPGDTIRVKRLYNIGENGRGISYTKEKYDEAAKILLQNDAFYVELFDPLASTIIPDQFDVGTVSLHHVIGRVTDYTNHIISIKLFTEELMPEFGKRFLKNFTKDDFDKTIRISHKLLIGKNTTDIDRIISCYLIDTSNERKETTDEIL